MEDSQQLLLELTASFVNRPDLIQGPGGNTSVKTAEGNMWIKASGYRFDEMDFEHGLSLVNSENISHFFFNFIPKNKEVDEQEMLSSISKNILSNTQGILYPKPSMETGFHAVLDKYVVHTHSVWTNLLNCSLNKTDLLDKIVAETGLKIALIPFVSPGFGLSYLITQSLKNAEVKQQDRPEIFLLANHGVIAHSNDSEACAKQLNRLDEAIQSVFNIGALYPETELIPQEDCFLPKQIFVNQILEKYKCDVNFFDQILFPDQIVFFSHQIGFNNKNPERKIQISEDFKIRYHCSLRDAMSVHETMTAYLFIYDLLNSFARPIDFIVGNEIDYINNMDMEKHRKQIKN